MSLRVLTALPVYNEARHLPDVLAEVRKFSQDILVVDDGSSDDTPVILSQMTDVQVATHEANAGYGAALRTAFEIAVRDGYDVLVTIDCDGQHEPRLIPEMAQQVFANPDSPVDIVSGSRYLTPFPGQSKPPEERRLINVKITKLLNDRLGFQLTDAFCGFKAYRVATLPKFEITELGYAMPLQFWVQAAALEMSIVEFPVPLIYLEEERSFGGSLDDAERRLAYYLEVFEREMCAASLGCDTTKCGA